MTALNLHTFTSHILKGQAMPPDLSILLKLQMARTPSDDNYADPLEATHHYLLSPEEKSALLDLSYLDETDRANPEVMANVNAIQAVFSYITLVAENDEGDLIGYWHGLEGTLLAQAPIVKYDSEGQFELLHGRTLSEAMLGDFAFDDDETFEDLRDWFEEAGINIKARAWDELIEPKAKTLPDVLHQKLYNQHRVAAGLKPVS